MVDIGGSPADLTGRLLADLGAEVIRLEPPGGDAMRHRPPLAGGDAPASDRSIYFLHFNTNKKSVTLDLDSHEGAQTFQRLLGTADVLVESFSAAERERLGLDDTNLGLINPGLVVASVTGFGLTGPYRDFKAPPIVSCAMGGRMSRCGLAEREPLVEPFDQAHQASAVYAAFGILLALFQRQLSGKGQLVETSAHEVQVSGDQSVSQFGSSGFVARRMGSRQPVSTGSPYGIFPCEDGYAQIVVISPAHWKVFLDWLGQPDSLTDPRWENRHRRAADFPHIEAEVSKWSATMAKREVFWQGQARHLTMAPILSPSEFIEDTHTQARGVFVDVEHPRVGRYKVVRAPFRLSGTPAWVALPAPGIGEHNEDVLGRLPSGQDGTAATQGPSRNGLQALPLEGLRVVDFSMAAAGPLMTSWLAAAGAEVFRVESESRRQRGPSGPGRDPRIVLARSVEFAEHNLGKKNITMNMGTEEGREVARHLIRISDIVVENFSPRVMEQWGLGYEEVRKLRPDVVVVRLPAFGLDGPYRDYVGLNSASEAFSSAYHQWAYSDDPKPVGSPVITPDYLSSAFGAVALTAALLHRRATGEGQLVEVAQVDAMSMVVGPAYMDWLLNGVDPVPQGNRHPRAAPHGCYPCLGHDRWCVIAVETEEEWRKFCWAIGEPEWTQDTKFSTLEDRLEHQDELDRRVAEWTSERTPHQVMHLLQRAGVAAGAVQTGEDVYRDPQLRSQGLIVEVPDPETGPIEYPAPALRLGGRRLPISRGGHLGEFSRQVFVDLLGLEEGELDRLATQGALR